MKRHFLSCTPLIIAYYTNVLRHSGQRTHTCIYNIDFKCFGEQIIPFCGFYVPQTISRLVSLQQLSEIFTHEVTYGL